MFPKVSAAKVILSRQVSSEQKFSQSGITVALSVPVIEAVQGVTQMASAVQDTRSERAKAMGAAMAAVKTREALAEGEAAVKSLADGKVPDGVSLSVSLGSSKSRSSSVSTSDSGRGSSMAAGGDVRIRATGGGSESDLTVRGSSLQSGGDIALKADNRVRLLSGQDTSAQSGSDGSGSAAIGLSAGLGEQSAGLSLTLAASRALGHRNGSATTQQASTVAAGKTLTIDSGGDTDILGGTASDETVKVAVGGNLNMASRQDTATFKEDSKNIGFNASIPIPGMSTGTASASLSAGKTAIRSDYASTQTTSGIKSGDGGFDVQVNGKTTLDGAVIASSDKAVQEGKNRFSSEGGLERKDIANSAEYSADSVSVGVGISGAKPDSQSGPALNSAGIGTDSGNASSITQAGISGIAGDTAVRSGDVGSGIKPIFDADRARADVNAQVAITKEFGPVAAKEWGSYSNRKFEEALKSRDEDEARCWAPDGVCRAGGHAVIGGLGGGVAGAAGSSVASPHVQAFLIDQGIPAPAAGAITQLAALGAGSAAGGTAAGAGAANEAGNNAILALPLLVEGVIAGGNAAIRVCIASPACANAVRLLGTATLARMASLLTPEDQSQIPGFGQASPLPPAAPTITPADAVREYGTPPLNDPDRLRAWLGSVLDGSSADEAQKWAQGFINTLPAAQQQILSDLIMMSVRDNQVEGIRREREATAELQAQYPRGSVLNQQYLRDKDGNIAIDPNTGTGRRLDHVVVVDGRVGLVVETTSMNARKNSQIRHEVRTREAGGTYILDGVAGKLIDVPSVSEIRRRP